MTNTTPAFWSSLLKGWLTGSFHTLQLVSYDTLGTEWALILTTEARGRKARGRVITKRLF